MIGDRSVGGEDSCARRIRVQRHSGGFVRARSLRWSTNFNPSGRSAGINILHSTRRGHDGASPLSRRSSRLGPRAAVISKPPSLEDLYVWCRCNVALVMSLLAFSAVAFDWVSASVVITSTTLPVTGSTCDRLLAQVPRRLKCAVGERHCRIGKVSSPCLGTKPATYTVPYMLLRTLRAHNRLYFIL